MAKPAADTQVTVPPSGKSATRQAAYKAAMKAKGYIQVNVWVPEGAAPEIQAAAEAMRAKPSLRVGPLVDRNTGRMASARATIKGAAGK